MSLEVKEVLRQRFLRSFGGYFCLIRFWKFLARVWNGFEVIDAFC